MIPPITSRRIKNNDAANAMTMTQPNAMFPVHKSVFVGWGEGGLPLEVNDWVCWEKRVVIRPFEPSDLVVRMYG